MWSLRVNMIQESSFENFSHVASVWNASVGLLPSNDAKFGNFSLGVRAPAILQYPFVDLNESFSSPYYATRPEYDLISILLAFWVKAQVGMTVISEGYDANFSFVKSMSDRREPV